MRKATACGLSSYTYIGRDVNGAVRSFYIQVMSVFMRET
jgi:hypothetical protein